MNKLSNNVYTYYVKHFDELSLEKQMHFAGRLFVWNTDPWALQKLDELQSAILASQDTAESLRALCEGRVIPLGQGSVQLREQRRPYFDRYPSLRTAAALLYWALQLDVLYGMDGRAAVTQVMDATELAELYNALMADREAIAALSTYAVNFLYLYLGYILGQDTGRLSMFFLGIGQPTKLMPAGRAALQLRVYLLTHCIVAESMFYSRQIPTGTRKLYRQHIMLLEEIIGQHFEQISLDTKFEFLVCCRMVGHTSSMEPAIGAEAEQSVSQQGTFLIDTVNAFRDSPYTSLDKSEHRNVLYVLSTLARGT